jgi:glycosyltransferase involved in cell wall biosynthesis
MKIAYLALEHKQARYHISGYAVVINELVKAFQENGAEVFVIVLGEWLGLGPSQVGLPAGGSATGGSSAAVSRAKGSVKRLVPGPAWEALKDLRVLYLDLKYRDRVLSEVRNFGPDVIYEQLPYLAWSGNVVARKLDIPAMVEMQAPVVLERTRDGMDSWLAGYALRRETRMLLAGRKVRVLTTALKQHILERGVPEEKIFIRPNGVDLTAFRPDAPPAFDVRERLGLGDKLVVGFLGSFFRWHGIDALLDGFAAAHRADPAMHLLIVGNGENMAELQAQRAALKLERAITFTGNVPRQDVPSYLAAMDVGVSPNSHWYGSPLKILEYGVMRRAVIVPDLPNVRDLMREGENCLMIRPSRADDIAGAILRLAGDPALRKSIAARFHDDLRTGHTWPQVGADVLRHLEAIRR